MAIGASTLLNRFLIPAFLITGRTYRFLLYTFYVFVVGVYLQLMVALFLFILMANYQYAQMNALTTDPYAIGGAFSLLVLIQCTMGLVRQTSEQRESIRALEAQPENSSESYINIRVDRKEVPLLLTDIFYIESLSDYVTFHTAQGDLIARERISQLEEQLSPGFLRVHRSFLVHLHHLDRYDRSRLVIHGEEIPISRSYRKRVMETLEEKFNPGPGKEQAWSLP